MNLRSFKVSLTKSSKNFKQSASKKVIEKKKSENCPCPLFKIFIEDFKIFTENIGLVKE